MEKVVLKLDGLDGNAFNLLGHWQRAAVQQGWPLDAVSAVVTEARAGDYNHLLNTLAEHSVPPAGAGIEADEV